MDGSKAYALAGVFGGIAVGGAFVIGSGLVAVTGIPLMPAIVNGLWVGLLIATASFVLKEYCLVGTAMMLVYGVAATVTVLLGPPGWHKIPIAVAMGFSWDICVWRRSALIFYLLGSVVFMLVGFSLLMLTFYLQNAPAFDKMFAVLPVVLSVSVVTMCVGALLGRRLVGVRLRDLPAFKRIVGR